MNKGKCYTNNFGICQKDFIFGTPDYGIHKRLLYQNSYVIRTANRCPSGGSTLLLYRFR
jgi:hypothetical protein